MPSIKPRIRLRLSSHNYTQLELVSRRGSRSRSEITDRALTMYFRKGEDSAEKEALYKRLDLMTRHDFRHSQDLRLLIEAFTVFVHYFLTVMPEINEADKEARAARGVSNFNKFLERLGEHMNAGGRTIKNALQDVLTTDADYFTSEELERLKRFDKASKKKKAELAK